MQQFLILLISGLVTGALYSLVASGLTLTYSATGIFNFSYGAVAYMCGYLFFLFNTGLHWNALLAAAVVVLVIAPALGLVLDLAIFRPLAQTSDAAKIMATVGLLIALPALTRFVSDRIIDIFNVTLPTSTDIAQISFPGGIGPVPAKQWTLFTGVTVSSDQVIVFVTAAVAAVGLWFLVRRTRIGLQMRAVVDRPALATLRGVNVARTSRVSWSVGMVLAALAGVVAAPIVGSVQSSPFLTLVFIGSAAAVLGGLKSVPVAFAGGLVLGVAQNMAAAYLSFTQDIVGFSTAVPFILLLVALLVLNQDRKRRAGSVNEDVRPLDYIAHLSPLRRRLPWAIATVALLAYIFAVASQFWLGVVGTGLALSIIFLSFVVVTGIGGMVNLAQAAFVNAAGLTTGLLIAHYGWPFLPAMLIGVLVSVAIGIVVALPALRLGGLYLALATLALGFILDNVLFGWRWFTNGPNGWKINPPALGPINLADRRTMAVVLLVIVLLTVLLIRNLQNSATGRRITAVRSSSIAAATSTISPVTAKLAVFATSAVIAAVGGVMLASLQGNVTGTSKVTTDGLLWLATVVLFGIRRPGAAVVAGLVSAVFPEILRGGIHLGSFGWHGTSSVEIPAILFGLGAVTLARSPDGILADMAEKRFAKRAARAARKSGHASAPDRVDLLTAQEQSDIAHDVLETAESLLAQGMVSLTDVDVQSTLTERAASAALHAAGLFVGYDKVEVLHGVDLSLLPGQIVGMFGANGSGKSTLVAACAGTLTPTAGTIRWAQDDVTSLPTQRRAALGLVVAPESRGIFPGLTVEENLRVTLTDRASRDRVFDRFPVLRERRRIPAGNLSGGEQQILTLAPFMAHPPKVLIADEPTLGLAPLMVEEIMRIFVELRDLGVAILLVEEKTAAVLPIADWVAVLELGHIVWQGPADATDHAKLTAAYFGEVTPHASGDTYADALNRPGGEPMTVHAINGAATPAHLNRESPHHMSGSAAVAPQLELTDICVRFGGVHALTDVSFAVNRQEVVGLIGPNGAGKTTLFDVISGVQSATTGQITLAGRIITRLGPTRRSRLGIRRTFQRSQPFGWLSVEDNILVALESGGGLIGDLLGRTGSQERHRRERVREVLAQFQLEKVKDEAAGRLPIGVIRMVELARAVVGRPTLLLLDEPTSGLDRRETDLLGDAMQRTSAVDHCTVLLVEHDVPFVMSRCDRVVALHLGSVLADGTPEEIQNNASVREAYLGQ